MEWVDAISQLVSNVGFPIACCAVMFYLYYKLTNTVGEINTTLASFKASIDNLSDAIAGLRIAEGKDEG